MAIQSRWARLTFLAAISPSGAVLGGLVDEWSSLGFTIWRSACRASGISLVSVTSFTLQLLPNAVIGALLGALIVQMIAFSIRHRDGHVRLCLAAHSGCALAMPAGLILCTLALPTGLVLIAEIALAVLAAICLLELRGRFAETPITLHP